MKAVNTEWDIDENYEGDLDKLQFLPDKIGINEGE